MEKISRKIFQPNTLTNTLINGVCADGDVNLSDFINRAVTNFYTPKNLPLKQEMTLIFDKINNRCEISEVELQASLARCVRILKDFPIQDATPLAQVFYHFTNSIPRVYRYDYILKVDFQQDALLHRLNDILKTVDTDFVLGTREFGDRSRDILRNWGALCQYSEIYQAMAVLIECEDIYQPLDVFRTIDLIKWLDNAITKSDLVPEKTPFPTNISLSDRYYGIRYEIAVYHTDNGYCHLSNDASFNFSPELQAYYRKYANTNCPLGDITEKDIKTVQELEAEGRLLFRRLTKKN